MDPNYAMAKFGLESKTILKSKHKGCWYYTKYFFFFLSIIQFLIILGLVLFMLYGNAHVSTEVRLKNVENRFTNLTIDYKSLSGNYAQLKSKLTSLEKENLNCSNLLTTALVQMRNRTVVRIGPPPVIHSELCRGYQNALDRFNTTYIVDTLQLKHDKLILQREHDRLKENCDQTISTLSNKVSALTSDKENLQKDKEDLENEARLSQTGCADINRKFDSEIDRMKTYFDDIINKNPHYSRCWSISSEIKNNIDETINRLKQDVNNVMFDNSKLKTENFRAKDNFQKCSQEKIAIISEKNNLSVEKGGLEKQLSEKREELNTSFSKYMKKEEELDNCRKMLTAGRMPSFPRNNA